MIESFVLVKENYEAVYRKYATITGSKDAECHNNEIICDDIIFEGQGEWCLLTLLSGDSFAEEILLELSDGKRLAYFYSDDSQMDCEFIVMENNQIIRKKYIYADTPELDEDEGHLLCEEENIFQDWNDIDYMIEVARTDPDELFKY